jgi:NTE family protein
VGAARALLEAGHHPDMVLGASAGALNAAWLAADPTLDGLRQLAGLWARVTRRQVLPLRPWALLAGAVGVTDHLCSSAPLGRWLRAIVPMRRVEDGALPLTVVATDLGSGDEVLVETGPLVPALMASCAMPGIFPPVQWEGRWLVDGSIAMDTAVGPAVEAGATRVFVLQSVPPLAPGPRRGPLDVTLRSSAILMARHHEAQTRYWSRHCQLSVVPPAAVPGTSTFDFKHSGALVEAGYQTAREWLRTTGAGAPARTV